MAFEIQQPETFGQTLNRAFQLALPGIEAGAQQERQGQQFRQGLASLLGVDPQQALRDQLAQQAGFPATGTQDPNAFAQFQHLSQISDPATRQAVLSGILGQQFETPLQKAQRGLLESQAQTQGLATPQTPAEQAATEALTSKRIAETEQIGRPSPQTQQQVEAGKVALETAKQNLKDKQRAYGIATSPEEKANRKVELEQAREDLRKTKKEIGEIGKTKPTRADMKFYVERGFTPGEAKKLRDSYIGVKTKEPETPKEIAMELSRWQTILNKTREVGFGGQLGEIRDQETYDLAEAKIAGLRGRLATAGGGVRVISPDGQHGTVPVNEWETYKNQGYTRE